MRILIFEGIATSGKSTLIERLRGALLNKQIIVASENETHIPIMDKTDDTHYKFFTDLIKQKAATGADLVIFDRLYLTQAHRTKVSLAPYAGIENLLMKYQACTAFLKVSDEAIAERIHNASQHRDNAWKDYIWTKGQTIEQIAQYYIDQQTSQIELLKTSSLPYKIFDTTEHGYAKIIKQLIDIIAH